MEADGEISSRAPLAGCGSYEWRCGVEYEYWFGEEEGQGEFVGEEWG